PRRRSRRRPGRRVGSARAPLPHLPQARRRCLARPHPRTTGGRSLMTLTLATEAPPFALPGIDGQSHSLDDYADMPALAVVWSCNHCPYVQAWEGRMIELQREFGDRGFRLVAINSNDAENYPEDSFEEMTKRARERGFGFDYLYDEDQSAAREYGAQRTPE